MNSFFKILITVPALLLNIACSGSMKNTKSLNVKIYGNCEMCEKTIEGAANVKNEVSLDWNKDSKMAMLSFDSAKTNVDVVLKRVAHAGYDNEKFLAPDDAYSKLPSCCQYVRSAKNISQVAVVNTQKETVETQLDSSKKIVEVNQLILVANSYFELKNDLIQANSSSAAAKSATLSQVLSSVKMDNLSSAQHVVWMKVYKKLIAASESISKSKDIEAQRTQFIVLSENMHELVKVAQLEFTVYYQHCPMYNDGKGADWLSLEKGIKNPYYGSQMLTCGSTTETIK